MRIIASMTTIPSRISLIRPVIEAALAQTIPVERIEINIPYYYNRKCTYYQVPSWLEEMDKVSIFRTKDYGPITKIAPTLLRYRDNREVYIFSIDDDCVYPPNQLALICRALSPIQRRIISRYGEFLNSDGSVRHMYGNLSVTMFEGFGGVLYPPDCIFDDFLDYINITSANEDCRRNDDLVLAMYFSRHHVPMHVYNEPSEENPYMVTGWLPHSEQDALVHTGHAGNYKRIHAYIKSLGWLYGEYPD